MFGVAGVVPGIVHELVVLVVVVVSTTDSYHSTGVLSTWDELILPSEHEHYSPWQLIKGVTGNSVFWVIVRDPAGALGHSSGHIGSPSGRKELGMDPRILHSGPASGMYI